MKKKGIVLLGLGPGDAGALTREAWLWLVDLDEIYLRTLYHQTVAALPETIKRFSFDAVYDKYDSIEKVFEEIVETIIELGERPEGVTYAVPGHPFVAEATCLEIVRRARQNNLPVRVIDGLSFLEPTFRALNLDPFPQIALVDAMKLSSMHVPSFASSQPALITQIYSKIVASEVKLTLMATYPDEYPVRLIHAAGTSEERVEMLQLHEIDKSLNFGLLSSLYVPGLEAGSAFEDFQEIIARLRAPDGCPWDKEQTHISLKPYLLEEAYEALEALDNEDMDALREELGDLLLQIVLHAQIGVEDGDFNMADVLRGISSKLIRRHPHVFAEVHVQDVAGVIHNWEAIKAEEREENGKPEKKGMLDGIPRALPALTQAQDIQKRVQRVGFDWPEIDGVLKKVYEELTELEAAEDVAERGAEAGDVFFAMVNLARWLGVDAESALRECNRRFRKRFAYIEQKAQKQGQSLDRLSFEEMDALWEEAKVKFKAEGLE